MSSIHRWWVVALLGAALGTAVACGAEPPAARTTPPPPAEDDAAALQNYISIYPEHPEHTPAAMLRLAKLWGDDAITSCRRRNAVPCDGLGQALNLGQRLSRDFPESPLVDDAVLAVGTWYLEAGRTDRGMAALMHLVCQERSADPFGDAPEDLREEDEPFSSCTPRWPDSDVLGQAWTRVAEQLFDGWTGHSPLMRAEPREREPRPDSESLPHAVVAFQNVVRLERDAARRDEAKLQVAWSLFLLARWRDGFRAASELARDEHLGDDARHIMVRCAAEPDWDTDGQPDDRRGVARPEVAELLERSESAAQAIVVALAQALAERGDEAAREALELFVSKWPDHPFAVTACEQLPRNRACRRIGRRR